MILKIRDPGIVLAVLASLFFGIGGTLGAEAAKHIHPITLAAYSGILASMFLIVLSYLVGEEIQVRFMLKNYLGETLNIAVLRFTLGRLLLFIGFSLIPAVQAILLLQIEPVFVLIIRRIFLGESVRPKQILLMVFSICGAFLLVTGGHVANLVENVSAGDIFVLLSLVFFAYGYIPSSVIMKRVNGTSVSITTNFIAGVLMIPFIFLFSTGYTMTADDLFLLIIYTVTFTVLGLYFWFSSLKMVASWIVSSMLRLGPIAGGLLAYLWLGEVLNGIQLLGATFIIMSSYLIAKEVK